MAGSHRLRGEGLALPLLHFSLNTITTCEARGSEGKTEGNKWRKMAKEDEGKVLIVFGESSKPSHTAPEINYFTYPLLEA